MTVACSECRSVFRVDPAKVPASGVRARCAVCGGIIAIDGGTLPVSVGSEAGGAIGGGASRGGVPAMAGIQPPSRPATPTPAVPLRAVAASTPAIGAPLTGGPIMAAPAVMPRQPTPAYSDIPVSFPVFGRTHGAPVVPDGESAPVVEAPPAPEAVVFPFPVEHEAIVAPPRSIPPVAEAPEPPPAPPASGGGRSSVNPFLRADPESRARRLARALVSDLVAYHPQKREEGVRDGTLRQLFRDDIRRSYEEYVEQVGRELAEGTRHFQDALNDILAGGRALF